MRPHWLTHGSGAAYQPIRRGLHLLRRRQDTHPARTCLLLPACSENVVVPPPGEFGTRPSYEGDKRQERLSGEVILKSEYDRETRKVKMSIFLVVRKLLLHSL